MYIKPIGTATTLLCDENKRLEAQHVRDEKRISQLDQRISELEDMIRAMDAEPPAPQIP